jgi:hypothetical protein
MDRSWAYDREERLKRKSTDNVCREIWNAVANYEDRSEERRNVP